MLTPPRERLALESALLERLVMVFATCSRLCGVQVATGCAPSKNHIQCLTEYFLSGAEHLRPPG